MKTSIFCLGLLIYTSIAFSQSPYVLVLGTAQDGGYPQAGCQKTCCQQVYVHKQAGQYVSSIALIDPASNEKWVFDATPDFSKQLYFLSQKTSATLPTGIFLTHAHIGHYTGLMHLGREVIGASNVKVYAMPRMAEFLTKNGPWSQLVSLKNINLYPLQNDSILILNDRIRVQSVQVPHRDEFSETVGFKIITAQKTIVFIPDIDKWEKWSQRITDVVKASDYALIDGTFYQDGEINRPMRDVPHPFVTETIQLFDQASKIEKGKIYFIHLNHTNPLLKPTSPERKRVQQKGFHIATQGQIIQL